MTQRIHTHITNTLHCIKSNLLDLTNSNSTFSLYLSLVCKIFSHLSFLFTSDFSILHPLGLHALLYRCSFYFIEYIVHSAFTHIFTFARIHTYKYQRNTEKSNPILSSIFRITYVWLQNEVNKKRTKCYM